MREDLPFADRVLQTLHNMCAIAANLARPADDVANMMQRDNFEVESILDNYRNEGFAEYLTSGEGKKLYYLNAKGIIKVCSLFT